MSSSIAENTRINGHFKNCNFKVADVTTLEVDSASCDVVFSNWLLMYLSDDEVRALATSMLDWVRNLATNSSAISVIGSSAHCRQVRPDGVVFFRESCFKQSGDLARKANPTHYR